LRLSDRARGIDVDEQRRLHPEAALQSSVDLRRLAASDQPSALTDPLLDEAQHPVALRRADDRPDHSGGIVGVPDRQALEGGPECFDAVLVTCPWEAHTGRQRASLA